MVPQVSLYLGNLVWLHIITVSSLGSRAGMFIMAKHIMLLSGWIVLQWTVLGCSYDFFFLKSFQVLVEKHLQLALNKWCAILKHLTYFSTSIILMNKAQNAQIQVNSHVIFTVYYHYLRDLGENSHTTQHRQRECTTVSFSSTVSVN